MTRAEWAAWCGATALVFVVTGVLLAEAGAPVLGVGLALYGCLQWDRFQMGAP